MQRTDHRKTGEIYVITAGVCWGMIGIFTRQMSAADLDSVQVTFLRNLIAALELALLIGIRDRKNLKIDPKDIWIFLGTGVLSIAFFNVCYFKTIQMTSLSVAAVLLYTAPAMVVIMSCLFFCEKMNMRKLIALLMAFAGCIFTTGIIGDQMQISRIGILIGLGSGFGYALYSIFGTIAAKKYSSYTISFYTFVFATAALLPICRITAAASIIKENPEIILVSIGLSTLSTIVPFVCYTIGLQMMEAGKASIMAFIEPLVACICGIVVFHEKMSLFNVVGMALIFISLMLLNVKKGCRDENK